MRRVNCPFHFAGRACLAILLLLSFGSGLTATEPVPYEGFVTLLYDGKTTNGIHFVEGVAPQQDGNSLLFTDAQPNQECYLALDFAVADFDLWIEGYSEETEYGQVGGIPGICVRGDAQQSYSYSSWWVPAAAGTAARPSLIHISRRGNRVTAHSAMQGETTGQLHRTRWPDSDQERVAIKYDLPWGARQRITKITLGEPGFKSLFNGKDLTGWEGTPGAASECWSVSEREIRCNGVGKTWLRSVEQYGDYNLKFDYRLASGGNSGLFIRVPADGKHHRENETLPPAGLEIQLLDDAAEKYRMLKDYQYSASVYDIVGAHPRVSRPAGEWNSFQIDADADRLQIWHNGQKVVDADEKKFPLLSLRLREGYLGLQNHDSVVSFRNIRIGAPLSRASGLNKK